MSRIQKPLVEPDFKARCDGGRIKDYTLQQRWSIVFFNNLDFLFADRPGVYVGCDRFWYPIESEPQVRTAPNVLVAFGRPKGYRHSYEQWMEEGVAPQVVFETLSYRNRTGDMRRRFDFYNRFGVLEYYLYDPYTDALKVHLRDGRLVEADVAEVWTSPMLGIAFDRTARPLTLRFPDGRSFQTYLEIGDELERRLHNRPAVGRPFAGEAPDPSATMPWSPDIDLG